MLPLWYKNAVLYCLDVETFHFKRLTRPRHAAGPSEDESAHRLESFTLDVDAEALGHVVDVHLAAEDEHPVALVHDWIHLDVVLVADIPDDLHEQILDRDEPRRAAVLVAHHRQ